MATPQFDPVKKEQESKSHSSQQDGDASVYVGTIAPLRQSIYDTPQKWNTRICDLILYGCMPFLDSWCCDVCVLSQLYSATYNTSEATLGPPTEPIGPCRNLHVPLCCGLVSCALIGGFIPAYSVVSSTIFGVATFFVRRRLRERYNIHVQPSDEGPDSADSTECCICFGEECGDCLLSWCCTCCTIAQMHREMTARGEYVGYALFEGPHLPPTDIMV